MDANLDIKWLNTTKITPYEHNPKVHGEEAVEKLAKIIEEYGWQQPIVVDGNSEIVLGTRRWLAAKARKWKQVPVVVASQLNEAQVRSLRLADNRLADDTPVDRGLVAAELSALQALDIDLAFTGFEPAEIHELLGAGTTEFLSESIDPNLKEGEQRTASDLHNYVQVTFAVTHANRDLIVKALKTEQQKRELPTAGAALIAICQEINDAD